MFGCPRISVTVGSFLTLVFLTTGCDESAIPTATPVLAATAVPAATSVRGSGEGVGDRSEPDPLVRGRQVYVSVGCGACHGEDALGSEIAPGLPGHTELQIRRQSRGPIGIMLVFGPASLSSDELDDLVAYVMSLEDEYLHGTESGSSAAEQSMSHHRMARLALDTGDLSEATHHVTHLLDLLEGSHLSAIGEVLAALESGDSYTAQHLVESMLVDIAVPAETLPQLHLKLALSAIRVEGAESAAHHLDHTTGLVSDHESDVIDQARDLIAGAEFLLAEQLIAGMLGVEAHGTEGDGHDDHAHDPAMDMDMEMGSEGAAPAARGRPGIDACA